MPIPKEYRDLHLAEELKLFEPLDKEVRKMGDVALGGIVGPSGSGKDTVLADLAKSRPDLVFPVVGNTTRKKRRGEVDGTTHYFQTHAEAMDDLHHQRYLQVAPGGPGDFYATKPEHYSHDGRTNLKIIYAREMDNFRRLGFKKVDWFQIVPHSFEAWMDWMSVHELEAEDAAERYKEAVQSYSLALLNRDTHFIINDEIPKASERIVRVIKGLRLVDATKGRSLAVGHLEKAKEMLAA